MTYLMTLDFVHMYPFSFENATFFYRFSKRSESTREQENGVFEKFHFGDRLRKVPFSVTVTEGQSIKKVALSKKSGYVWTWP